MLRIMSCFDKKYLRKILFSPYSDIVSDWWHAWFNTEHPSICLNRICDLWYIFNYTSQQIEINEKNVYYFVWISMNNIMIFDKRLLTEVYFTLIIQIVKWKWYTNENFHTVRCFIMIILHIEKLWHIKWLKFLYEWLDFTLNLSS